MARADLALLAVEVAEDQLDLERVGVDAGGLAQLLDRQIDLVGDQEVQAEHVVRRLAQPAAIDPPAVAQLVALPGLADRRGRAAARPARRGRAGSRPMRGSRPSRCARGRAGARRPRRAASPSTTTIEVILRCSMMCSASAASVSRRIVTGSRVITSPARAARGGRRAVDHVAAQVAVGDDADQRVRRRRRRRSCRGPCSTSRR